MVAVIICILIVCHNAGRPTGSENDLIAVVRGEETHIRAAPHATLSKAFRWLI